MWVCHCVGLHDRQIREAVEAGAGDIEEVGRACGAATHCGGCADEVRRILDTVLTAVPA